MVFDEDSILLSFFDRYELPAEIEELKQDVLKYIGAGVSVKPAVVEEPSTTGDSLDAVSNSEQSLFLLTNHYALTDVIANGFSCRHEKAQTFGSTQG